MLITKNCLHGQLFHKQLFKKYLTIWSQLFSNVMKPGLISTRELNCKMPWFWIKTTLICIKNSVELLTKKLMYLCNLKITKITILCPVPKNSIIIYYLLIKSINTSIQSWCLSCDSRCFRCDCWQIREHSCCICCDGACIRCHC